VAVGVLLVVAGVRMLFLPRTFGWFAYAPLSDAQFSPPLFTTFRRGVACVALGTLLLGGAGGYALGRRSARAG